MFLMRLVFITLVEGSLIKGVFNQNVSCGMDFSATLNYVHEGRDHVTMYPWMGFMYYDDPIVSIYVIPVVLIAKQFVLSSASDLDKYPKIDIRKRSRVVLGSTCKGLPIPIKQYTFHEDYNVHTYSSLALIQLDTSLVDRPLYPICLPPKKLFNIQMLYAISLPQDCSSPYLRVYRMRLVDLQECQIFYRKSGLDIKKMWPTETVCARAVSARRCVWGSGAVLVTRLGDKWRLYLLACCYIRRVGVGVRGPGCGAVGRFVRGEGLRAWLRPRLSRRGGAALTRLAPHYLILRRSMSNVQRYGPCEPEEMKTELYTDRTTVQPPHIDLLKQRRVRYNLTIFANVEYSCIIMRVFYNLMYENQRSVTPRIFLRRWCASPEPICYDAQLLQIEYYVEIYFQQTIHYHLYVYGKEIKIIDSKKLLNYENHKLDNNVLTTAPSGNAKKR